MTLHARAAREVAAVVPLAAYAGRVLLRPVISDGNRRQRPPLVPASSATQVLPIRCTAAVSVAGDGDPPLVSPLDEAAARSRELIAPDARSLIRIVRDAQDPAPLPTSEALVPRTRDRDSLAWRTRIGRR